MNEAGQDLTELCANVLLARELDLLKPGVALRPSASSWATVAACPRSYLKTVMSISMIGNA